MLVLSCVTLVKTIRDVHESKRLVNRLATLNHARTTGTARPFPERPRQIVLALGVRPCSVR